MPVRRIELYTKVCTVILNYAFGREVIQSKIFGVLLSFGPFLKIWQNYENVNTRIATFFLILTKFTTLTITINQRADLEEFRLFDKL